MSTIDVTNEEALRSLRKACDILEERREARERGKEEPLRVLSMLTIRAIEEVSNAASATSLARDLLKRAEIDSIDPYAVAFADSFIGVQVSPENESDVEYVDMTTIPRVLRALIDLATGDRNGALLAFGLGHRAT